MKIFKNALRTDRAFMHFNKIQHISWNYHVEEIELKVHSSAGIIIQYINEEQLSKLLETYSQYENMKILRQQQG